MLAEKEASLTTIENLIDEYSRNLLDLLSPCQCSRGGGVNQALWIPHVVLLRALCLLSQMVYLLPSVECSWQSALMEIASDHPHARVFLRIGNVGSVEEDGYVEIEVHYITDTEQSRPKQCG